MDSSIHHLHNINQWAVLVAALFQWLLGAAWYSPVLFAKPWMAMIGANLASKTPAEIRKGMVAGMLASFLGDLALSFILWHFVAWSGSTTFFHGAFVGSLCWLGFFIAPNLAQGIYEGRPLKLFAINNGYWFFCLTLAGGLLAIWK